MNKDLSGKNQKFKKLVALTAAAGIFSAAGTALLIKAKKRRPDPEAEKADKGHQNGTDDLELLDFASIQNDTPREYVSISINAHAPKEQAENETGSSQEAACATDKNEPAAESL